jgi:hypothetical protein
MLETGGCLHRATARESIAAADVSQRSYMEGRSMTNKPLTLALAAAAPLAMPGGRTNNAAAQTFPTPNGTGESQL